MDVHSGAHICVFRHIMRWRQREREAHEWITGTTRCRFKEKLDGRHSTFLSDEQPRVLRTTALNPGDVTFPQKGGVKNVAR